MKDKTSTDYLSRKDFDRFTETIPKLESFTKIRKPPLTAAQFQLLFKIAYFCAVIVPLSMVNLYKLFPRKVAIIRSV